MPLTFCSEGEERIIARIGGNEEVRHHLENLGFVVGGKVRIVSKANGNLIVNVKETKIAVNKETALKIIV